MRGSLYSCFLITGLPPGSRMLNWHFETIYRPVGTTAQIMSRLHHITDTYQVHKYPDSSISKVLTILKMADDHDVKKKTAGKAEGTEPLCFLWEIHKSLFFYNVNATVSFGNHLTLSIFEFFTGLFVGFVSQLCSPSNVCAAWTHMCIHKAYFPSPPCLAQLFYLHWTLVWLFIHKTRLLSSPHPPSWLWL